MFEVAAVFERLLFHRGCFEVGGGFRICRNPPQTLPCAKNLVSQIGEVLRLDGRAVAAFRMEAKQRGT